MILSNNDHDDNYHIHGHYEDDDHDDHREGGWPKDVKTELMEQKNKFIRKVNRIIIIITGIIIMKITKITVIIIITITKIPVIIIMKIIKITVIIIMRITKITVIIIIAMKKVVKEDMFKYSTTKLGKAMEKVHCHQCLIADASDQTYVVKKVKLRNQ